jgi:hypothetical protein
MIITLTLVLKLLSVGIILKLFGVILFILVVLSPNVRMVGFLSFVAIHHQAILKDNDLIEGGFLSFVAIHHQAILKDNDLIEGDWCIVEVLDS